MILISETLKKKKMKLLLKIIIRFYTIQKRKSFLKRLKREMDSV